MTPDARDFHNMLRILGSIDYRELKDAGVDIDAEDSWELFCRNPYKWAIINASDSDYEALFTIIESRMP